MGSEEQQRPQRGRTIRAVALLVFLVASVTIGVIAVTQGWIRPAWIQEVAVDAGPLGWLVFIASVVVLELLWMPRVWGLLAAGVLFGPVAGALLSFVADMIGAVLCYGLGRGGAKEWVEGILSRRPRAAKVADLLTKRRGVVTVAVLRVVPIAHYTAVSYAAGVAGIRFAPFVIGNAIGILPYALIYPFVGHSALDPRSPEFLVGVGVVLVSIVVTTIVARRVFR